MPVITFSRVFPVGHPKAGQPTHFVEKVWESLYPDIAGWDGFSSLKEKGFDIGLHNIYQPKHHTIRAGSRWKVGDKFSPRVWSGKPYNSKQIQFAPDIEVKKVWEFEIAELNVTVNNHLQDSELVSQIAANDGLTLRDFLNWLKFPKAFTGQIICWNERIEY